MRRKFIYLFLLTAGLIFIFFYSKTPPKAQLKILTYSSFAGLSGPGRVIKQHFEAFCGCEIIWILAEDSTALRQRFELISGIDMVIGWDQISLLSAKDDYWEDISFLKKNLKLSYRIVDSEVFFQNPRFFPLDWSPIGFLRKDPLLYVKSLKSLPEAKGKISFPEPRSSMLGLQFYYWIYEVFKGNETQISRFLKRMRHKVYGPAHSWSLSYGFFQKGKTDRGLSYLSSLLYHQNQDKYFFTWIKEGQAYQVEFFSVSKKAPNKKQALEFAKFLVSKKAQKIIMEKHYMFSILKEHKLLQKEPIKLISYKRLDKFIKNKQDLLDLWKKNLY